MTAALLGRLFDGFETFEDRAVVEDWVGELLAHRSAVTEVPEETITALLEKHIEELEAGGIGAQNINGINARGVCANLETELNRAMGDGVHPYPVGRASALKGNEEKGVTVVGEREAWGQPERPVVGEATARLAQQGQQQGPDRGNQR